MDNRLANIVANAMRQAQQVAQPVKIAKRFALRKKADHYWQAKKDETTGKWYLECPKGKYEDAEGHTYKFNSREDALEEIEFLRAEHKYKKELKKDRKTAATAKQAAVTKKAKVTLELDIDEYIDLVKKDFDSAPEDWKNDGVKSLFPKYLEVLEEWDGNSVASPDKIVDSFCLEQTIVSRKDDFTATGSYADKFEEYDGNWDAFCENEAWLYNDKYACL